MVRTLRKRTLRNTLRNRKRALRKTLRKRALRKTLRKRKTLRMRGGVNFDKDATVTELEGEPTKGLNRMVVASGDGFVGSGSDFVAHTDYKETQISTIGGFRSVFKR